jgi:hypothetical protein
LGGCGAAFVFCTGLSAATLFACWLFSAVDFFGSAGFFFL